MNKKTCSQILFDFNRPTTFWNVDLQIDSHMKLYENFKLSSNFRYKLNKPKKIAGMAAKHARKL